MVGKVNCVEDDEDDEYAFTVGLGKTWDRSGSEIVDLQVGGVILNGVLIDSGSSCNIIDQKTWEELKQKGVKCKAEKTNQKLYPYGTSEPLDTLGKFEASVNLAGKDVTAEFIVICNEGRLIMGRKTAMELDALRLGPQVNVVSTPDLVDKYKACFEGVGKLTDYQVKIHVNKEVNPVVQHPRRVPFSLREKVESKLHELEQLDIIEKVKGPTPWVSPIVVVPKPSGEIRLCVDMRRANEAIVRERHPIPTVDEVLQDMTQSSVFSETDHKPLEVIYSSKSQPSARIQRWVLRLQPYEFTVMYRPGPQNIADALSRLTQEISNESKKCGGRIHSVRCRECSPQSHTYPGN